MTLDQTKVAQNRGRIGGRAKGTPNKTTTELKEMILKALDNAGGIEYLTERANENPGAFMALLGKVLPLQVTGDGGGPIKIVFTSADADL